MPRGQQLDLPVHDDETLFLTDEQLDQRLRRLENGLADFEARIPAMRREVTELRRWLVRAEIRQAKEPDRESGNSTPGLIAGG